MTAIAQDAAPRFGGEPSDVAVRLDGLTEAVDASKGRIDDAVLEPAEVLSGRAAERLLLSGEHTIVALAGATGSGKSSLFNSLTDLDLAGVGVRRPTTSWALACAWGPDGAAGLLEWMGIPPRHQVSRMSMLDTSSDDTKLDGLVLLDLPDHDSTEVSHHVEMDRLVRHSDLLVWVLDPQKYADAAIHDRYIRPMASFADVTVVVLNQIDRIPYEQRERTLEDVRRILAEDGLPGVEVIGVSATRGDGVDDLKRELAARIRSKSSARGRLTADIHAAAEAMAQAGGTREAPGVSPADREALDASLVAAAGVPQIVTAIGASTRRRAVARTGWPLARWLKRFRRDRLSELGLDEELSGSALAQSVIPEASHVQRADAELAIREFGDKASVGLDRPWRDAVRRASMPRGDDTVDALDRAITTTDLGVARSALWWRVVQAVQLVSLVAFIAGMVWLASEAVTEPFSSVSLPDLGEIAGYRVAAFAAVGGLLLGIGIDQASRLVARISGGRKAARANRSLREAIGAVTQERVVDPVQGELDAYSRYRTGILTALG